MPNKLEIVLIHLDNGASAVMLHDKILHTFDPGNDKGESPTDLVVTLAKALRVPVREVQLDALTSPGWNWRDVQQLVPPAEPIEVKQCNLIVSLDGGEFWLEASSGVRCCFKKNEHEDRGDVLINVTHEGIITDVYAVEEFDSDHDTHLGTSSEDLNSIVTRVLHASN